MAEYTIPNNAIPPKSGLTIPCITKKCKKRNCDQAQKLAETLAELNSTVVNGGYIRSIRNALTRALNSASIRCGSGASSLSGSEENFFDRSKLNSTMDKIAISTGLAHPVTADNNGDYSPIALGLLEKYIIASDHSAQTGDIQDEAYAQLLLNKYLEAFKLMKSFCPYPSRSVMNPITGKMVCTSIQGTIGNGQFTAINNLGIPTVTTMRNGKVVSVETGRRPTNTRPIIVGVNTSSVNY